MIKSKIRISDGEIVDFYEAYGFVYVDADERTAPNEKEYDKISYAEEAGEHIDPRTVFAPFDYTAKFIIEAPNKDLTNVNAKIQAFNNAIIQKDSKTDVIEKREIEFYNLLNRVKITGYPSLVSTPTEVYHSDQYGEMDFAMVELKIHVINPNKCDFALNTDYRVRGDGDDLLVPALNDISNIEFDVMRWTRRRNKRQVTDGNGNQIPPLHLTPKVKWGWTSITYTYSKRTLWTFQLKEETYMGMPYTRLIGAKKELVERFFGRNNGDVYAKLNGIRPTISKSSKNEVHVKLRLNHYNDDPINVQLRCNTKINSETISLTDVVDVI